MSSPFVGQLLLVGFNFAPVDWAMCQGQLLPISENETLFTLIGTTYGGDGQQTFGIPNLQGRVTVHQGSRAGNNFVIGQLGGAEQVTITANQYPSHSHSLLANSGIGSSNNPSGAVVATVPEIQCYSDGAPANPMNASALGLAAGGSQPHDNMQPFLVCNWIISLYGIYPTPS